MFVVISGEGISDLGACSNQQGRCHGELFVAGPMTCVLDTIIESSMGYSVLDVHGYEYLSESHLEECEQRRRGNRRGLFLPGRKSGQETGYFYINAWILAQETLALETQRQDRAIAVLFRDTDGTRSTRNGLWQAKWNSMLHGFARGGLEDRGVPMLPKPKSEAWLLCAFKNPAYRDCAALEEISGNDSGANPAKDRLDAATEGATRDDLVHQLRARPFDHVATSEQMPSFECFRERLLMALEALRRLPAL